MTHSILDMPHMPTSRRLHPCLPLPDGICNPVRNVSWLDSHGCTQNISDVVANPVALRFARRTGRECRNPEAMDLTYAHIF